MDPRLQLVLLLTDKVFSIMQHIQEVKEMTKVEVLAEIGRERVKKDNLVADVTLPDEVA